jgi:putative endonuclease
MAAKKAIHGRLGCGHPARARVAGRDRMFDRVSKAPCVYMMASRRNGVLYIGVTSGLSGRNAVHKQNLHEGFTKRYGVHRLVYYEMYETMVAAIERETRLKKWKRAWKVRLIEGFNPEWVDLFDEQTGAILDGPADVERGKD